LAFCSFEAERPLVFPGGRQLVKRAGLQTSATKPATKNVRREADLCRFTETVGILRVRQLREHADGTSLISPKSRGGWGYKPIPGAKTPDEEKKTLDEWAREQDSYEPPSV
jgi:hypothetical protein